MKYIDKIFPPVCHFSALRKDRGRYLGNIFAHVNRLTTVSGLPGYNFLTFGNIPLEKSSGHIPPDKSTLVISPLGKVCNTQNCSNAQQSWFIFCCCVLYYLSSRSKDLEKGRRTNFCWRGDERVRQKKKWITQHSDHQTHVKKKQYSDGPCFC